MYNIRMLENMKKIIFATLALAIILTTTSTSAKNKNEIVLGASFSSVGGISASELYQLTDQLLTMLMERKGMKVVLKKYFTGEEVYEAFLKNELDAAPLYPFNIAYVLDNGGKVIPIASYSLNGEKFLKQCFWQSSTKKTAKLEDLLGTTLIRHDLSFGPFLQIRELMYDHGIDEPVWKMFDKMLIAPSSNSAFMALVMGDADYYITPCEMDKPLKIFMPQLVEKITHKLNSDKQYGHPLIVMNGKTVSNDIVVLTREAVKDFAVNTAAYAKDNPTAKLLHQYMKIYGVKIVPGDESMYKEEIALYQKAKKKGWLDETNFILTKLAEAPPGTAIEIKMGFPECKKWCEKTTPKKDQVMACIDSCMGN